MCEGRGAFSTYLAPLGVSKGRSDCIFLLTEKRIYSYLPACLSDSLGLREKFRSFPEAIHKAGQNRQLFDTFDNEFSDKHCWLSAVNWSIKLALSTCHCQFQVCYRWCRIIDKRNVTSLSFFSCRLQLCDQCKENCYLFFAKTEAIFANFTQKAVIQYLDNF